jgi:hypothetical protein
MWRNDADWVFTPGAAITSCRFSIHVPAGAWAGSVLYEVYSGDTTNGFDGEAFATFHLDQQANAGAWVTKGPFSFTTGTIDLSITDAGSSSSSRVVADVVTATC